jgi:outer membrane protein assembly factor BamB
MNAFRVLLAALALAVCAVAQSGLAAEKPAGLAQLIASPEPGWPQWRGPRRDGLCLETNLLPRWPEGGPRLLWKSEGIGRGYSAPILTGGRIYLAGDVETELHLFALDLEGKRVWTATNGVSWKDPYPGARAACAYSEGRLYHLNAHGRLACVDAATGREVWLVNILERFRGKNLTWALGENVLVDGPRVIVTPGGAGALMAALDKRTGTSVWTTPPLRLGPSNDPAQVRLAEPAGEIDSTSYASPILIRLGQHRLLVGCSQRHAFGVDADSGRLLWTQPMPTRYQVIAATPILVGDAVFITAPHTEHGGLFRLRPQGDGVLTERVWTTKLDTCHGSQVFVDGLLFGSFYQRSKGWAALDPATGEVRYQLPDLAQGSVLYADRRLYCLSQEGVMALLEPTPQAFVDRGRFRLVPDKVNDAWTHPVILDGRLYLRYHESLFCYDVRAR